MVGGDGIGPEVTAEALKVLDATGVSYERIDYDLGAARYLRDGTVLPDSVLDEWRQVDAILLGAVGDPAPGVSAPAGLVERGVLLRTRFELDMYINLRPFRLAPKTDFEVIRVAHEIGLRGLTGMSFICIPPGSAVVYRLIVYIIAYLMVGLVLSRNAKKT